VLGIDKTYNLGKFYVTTLVYKHPLLTHSGEEDQHPTILAAALIHHSSTYKKLFLFLSYIHAELQEHGAKYGSGGDVQSRLGTSAHDIPIGTSDSSIVYGSDEEKAYLKAMAMLNPGKKSMKCILHLKKNFVRYLTNYAAQLNMDGAARQELVQKLYSRSGILTAKSVRELDIALNEVAESFEYWDQQHKDHLHKVLGDLRDHVYVPAKSLGMREARWMNNGCESINNILKNTTGRKPLPNLTQLITLLDQELSSRDSMERQAVHGRGMFDLCGEGLRHQVRDDVWAALTPAQKAKKMSRYYAARLPWREEEEDDADHGQSDSEMEVAATEDEDIPASAYIYKHPTSSRKPGQRTRPTSARSTSICKRKKNNTREEGSSSDDDILLEDENTSLPGSPGKRHKQTPNVPLANDSDSE
jgi:hypothetical protein